MSEVITATEIDGIFYVEATELQKKQNELSNLKAELSTYKQKALPTAPTEAMLLAGANCQLGLDVIESKKLRANDIYLHMVKAYTPPKEMSDAVPIR